MNLNINYVENHSRMNFEQMSLEMLTLLERVSIDIETTQHFNFDEVKAYQLLERIVKGYPLSEVITLVKVKADESQKFGLTVLEGLDTIMTLQAMFRPEMLNIEPKEITVSVVCNDGNKIALNLNDISRGTMPWLKLMRKLEEQGVSSDDLNQKIAEVPDRIWNYKINATLISNEAVASDIVTIQNLDVDLDTKPLKDLKEYKTQIVQGIRTLEKRKGDVEESIAKRNSLAFIAEHKLTKSDVKEIEGMYGDIHDSEKLCRWIKENIKDTWFSWKGYIRKNSEFRYETMYSGELIGRYKDLTNEVK